MRDAIKSNAVNWKNCAMHVQDIKYPGVNVTAEISVKEANNFKKCCQILSQFSHKKIIDDYLSKIQSPQEAKRSNLGVENLKESTSSKLNDAAQISLDSLRSAVKNAEKEAKNVHSNPSSSKMFENVTNSIGSLRLEKNRSTLSLAEYTLANIRVSNTDESSTFSLQNMRAAISNVENTTKTDIPEQSTPKRQENITKTEYLSKLAKAEMKNILSRSDARAHDEEEIFNNLSYYFYTIDSTAEIARFGSTSYGFGGLKTNFNILAVSGVKESNFVGLLDRLEPHMFRPNEIRKLTPDALLQKFENSFKTASRLSSEFGILQKLEANRVQGKTLKLLHKKSRIQCILHFGDNTAMKLSSQIIHNYMTLSPICKCFLLFSNQFPNLMCLFITIR